MTTCLFQYTLLHNESCEREAGRNDTYGPQEMAIQAHQAFCPFYSGLDIISEKYEYSILFGDLDFDILDKSKSSKSNNVCDIFNLSNTVK